jgi:hypothetical protein
MPNGLYIFVFIVLIYSILGAPNGNDRKNKPPVHVGAGFRVSWAIASSKTVSREYTEYLNSYAFDTDDSSLSEEGRLHGLVFGKAMPVSNPTIVFLGGGTASGKTSAKPLMSKLGFISSNHVNIDADEILVNLIEWKGESISGMCAATVLHDRSSNLAKKFYQEAIDQKMNVVYSSTMSNYQSSIDKLPTGYKRVLAGSFADLVTCATRGMERGKEFNRYVPLDAIIETNRGFSQNFVKYIPHFDLAFLFTMVEYEMKTVVFEAHVKDWKLFSQFLDIQHVTRDEVEAKLNPDILELYDRLDRHCFFRKVQKVHEFVFWYYMGFILILALITVCIFLSVVYWKRTHHQELLLTRRLSSVSFDDKQFDK